MNMRGYFGIGIEGPKFGANFGTLWRSAHCLGADFIFSVNARYENEPTDTTKAWKHVPFFEYLNMLDFIANRPKGAKIIGVEIGEESRPLSSFQHPERAIYLLGPEDGSLSKIAKEVCSDIVQIESKYCLNVAVAGAIVMYDRSLFYG